MLKENQEIKKLPFLYLNGQEIGEKSTKELKQILGDFEFEYVYNSKLYFEERDKSYANASEILGACSQGTVKHALKFGAITRRFERIYNDWVYYVHLPQYYEYNTKVRIIGELNWRREYAEEINEYPLEVDRDIVKSMPV